MKKDNRPYRKGVVVIVIDEDSKYLVLQLNRYGEGEWNFLGGGRKKGETEEENLYRELREELSCGRECFKILGRSKKRLKYNFPANMKDHKFKGQVKDQFLVEFVGDKEKIKLQIEEVRRHKWIGLDELSEHLVFPNQYENARAVIEELVL